MNSTLKDLVLKVDAALEKGTKISHIIMTKADTNYILKNTNSVPLFDVNRIFGIISYKGIPVISDISSGCNNEIVELNPKNDFQAWYYSKRVHNPELLLKHYNTSVLNFKRELLDVSLRNYHVCANCGYPQTNASADYATLKEKLLCFTCNFWDKRTKDKRLLISDGHIYSYNPPSKNESKYLGHGGAWFRITNLSDPSDIKYSNNVWHSGEMPPSFKIANPDTHIVKQIDRKDLPDDLLNNY